MINEFLFNSPFHLVWIVVSLLIVILVVWVSQKYGKEKKEMGLITLITLYNVLVVTSIVAATKIIKFELPFLPELFVPAGVIVYAASFLITDLISEVYGKEEAKTAVFFGFASMLIFSLYSLLMVEWQPAPYWNNQEAYGSVVGLSIRISIAGFISFIISQMWDVIVFHRLKKENKEYGKPKHLWIRNNVSTLTSQFIDSTMFISIAFIGIYDSIGLMIISQWFIKCIIALIDTPFAYLGRYILNPPPKKPEGFKNTIKEIINNQPQINESEN